MPKVGCRQKKTLNGNKCDKGKKETEKDASGLCLVTVVSSLLVFYCLQTRGASI